MRTAPMCYSILRVPRFRVYSLVNTWWEGCVLVTPTCKRGSNFRLLSSNAGGHERNSGSWSRRPLTKAGEGISKNSLSSAANVRHDLSEEVNAKPSIDLTINVIDGNCADIRQLIVENKDLANLATFIVFDLETTGFTKGERIIEIALQDLHGGENSTFQTLINPGRAVFNSEIHGIRTEDVSKPGVPRMEELIPILLQYVQSRLKPGGYVVLVAHNARTFDVPFLVREFNRCGFEIPSNWFFMDTSPLGRTYMKSIGSPKYSLTALREHFEIPLKGKIHRAMEDVRVLSMVLSRLTYVLKLPRDELVQKAFTANELTSSSAANKKKKKGSS